jgi:hypothetical protein
VSGFDDADGAERDDGTLAPTAAIGSAPFAPEIVFPAMVAMRERYPGIFGQYGFRDSFNPSLTDTTLRVAMGTVHPESGWIARDHLGIDQGPILLMLENHRSELIWKTMRTNRYLVQGLRAAGFRGGWLDSIRTTR